MHLYILCTFIYSNIIIIITINFVCVYCVILVFPKLWGPNVPTGITTLTLLGINFPYEETSI